LEVLSVKVGDVLAPNQQIARSSCRTFGCGSSCRNRARPHQARRFGEGAGGRVSEKDFSGVVEQIAREAEFTPRTVQTTEERISKVFRIQKCDGNSSNEWALGCRRM